MAKDTQVTIQISTNAVMKVILYGLLLWLLFFLRDLVLVLLTAIVIASAIEPATKWFMKYRIPRIPSVLMVYVTVAIFLFVIFYFFIPPILDDTAGFYAQLPQYIENLNASNPIPDTQLISPEAVTNGIESAGGFSISELISNLQNSIANVSEGFIRTISAVFGGILSFIFIVVFSFYFAVQENGINDFLRIVTPVKHQKYIIDLWRRSQIKIGLWMQGQLVLALIIGVLTYLGLTIFGVQYAFLLAVLAAMFELIPIFGPILAAIPAVIVALFESVGLGFMVVGLYVIIQQFENHLIYPLVVKKVIGVPPMLVIIAIIIGAKLAGFLGILLSVPVAAALQEFVKDIQKEKNILATKKKKTM